MACSDKKRPDEDLKQAFKLHQAAIALRNYTGDQLAELTKGDSLFVQAYKVDLDSISHSLAAWDDQLVEVPGFEEEHDHSAHDHSGHAHDHDEQPDLSPEQHLQIQQYLLQEIQAIEKRINQVKGQR